MKTVKKTGDYTIEQRSDGRYAVRASDRKWINGDAKVEILVREGFLKEQPKAKPQAEAPAEETAEEVPEEAAGTQAEDGAAEQSGEES